MCQKLRNGPGGWQMPSPRAVQNLQMPHPRDWQGGQMGTGGIDWRIKNTILYFTRLKCLKKEILNHRIEKVVYFFQCFEASQST